MTSMDAATAEATHDLIYRDELTGLYNRRYFNKRFSEMGTVAAEGTVALFAIAIIDVDHFKAINDHYGHLEGDELLRQVAAVYRMHEGEGVVPVRYAGDEFVILMEGLEKARAVEMGWSICRAVAEQEFRLEADAPVIRVTNSIGVAHFPDDTQAVKSLFELADHAALASKRKGRNCVSTCDAGEEVVDKDALYRRFPCPKMVGRDSVVSELEGLVPPRVVERPPIVVLQGEGGLGKTRLLSHLEQKSDRERTQLLIARGSPALSCQPFGLLCVALRRFCKEDPAGTPFLAGALDDRQRAEVARYISTLLMYVKADGDDLGDTQRREVLIDGFVSILKALAGRKSLALFFDDAQFLDRDTVAVLRRFAECDVAAGTMICVSLRGGADGFEANANVVGFLAWARERQLLASIQVEPLSLDEVAEMVEAVLPHLDRPLDLAASLFERTLGIPLFVEELVKYLIHNDLVVVEGRTLKLGDFSSDELPGNVVEALAARTEDLDEEVRAVLAAAASLGPEFNLEVLSRVEGKDETYVADLLQKARRAELIREEANERDTYDFVFTDEQSAFYNTLGEAQKKAVHGRAGRALEELASSGGDVAGTELAFHFQQAGERERSLEYINRLRIPELLPGFEGANAVLSWTRVRPGDKEWGEEVRLTEAQLKCAQRLARVIRTAVQNFRIFPPHSEILIETRDAAYGELAGLLEVTDTLTFSEAGEAGLINGQEPVIGVMERNPVADLVSFLARTGLKGVSFRRGLAEGEMFRFLELLARRPVEIKEEGGWTEILPREGINHVVVNERLYVATSERELLEGRGATAVVVVDDKREDADSEKLRELVDLVVLENRALRELLLEDGSLRTRLEQLLAGVRSESGLDPNFGPAEGTASEGGTADASVAPWLAKAGGSPRAAAPVSLTAGRLADTAFVGEIWDDLLVSFRELESGVRQRVNTATRSLLARGPELLEPLIKFLKSSDDLRARKIALKILERSEPNVKTRLLREIRNTEQADELLRLVSLLDGLGVTSDVLPPLELVLHSHHRELRREAIRILEQHASFQAEAMLMRAVESEHEPVKVDAISALSRMKSVRSVEVLVKVIAPVSTFSDEHHIDAQCAACAALGRLRNSLAIKPLMATLRRRWLFPFSWWRTKPSPVRAAAAAALGQFLDDSVRRVLERHVRDGDVAVRSVAKLQLGGSMAEMEMSPPGGAPQPETP